MFFSFGITSYNEEAAWQQELMQFDVGKIEDIAQECTVG
jgi:hypothetical protein